MIAALGGVVAAVAPRASACEARVELDPPEAWVGQQVLHEIVITGVSEDASIEWLQPPSFPDMRASLLPAAPIARPDAAHTRRQRRAIHPTRAGRLELPPTPFRCVPDGSAVPVVAETPRAWLVTQAPPRAGRPPGWRGLVGRVHVQVRTSAARVHVGDSVRVIATLVGTGLLRQASFEWPRRALEEQTVAPELFDVPARDRDQPGVQNAARRIEALDVVPHAPGELWVPAIEVAYWDPDDEQYASAASTPVAITVDPEPEPAASPAERAGDRSEREADAGPPGGMPGWGSGALVVAIAGLVALGWLVAVGRSRARPRDRP